MLVSFWQKNPSWCASATEGQRPHIYALIVVGQLHQLHQQPAPALIRNSAGVQPFIHPFPDNHVFRSAIRRFTVDQDVEEKRKLIEATIRSAQGSLEEKKKNSELRAEAVKELQDIDKTLVEIRKSYELKV